LYDCEHCAVIDDVRVFLSRGLSAHQSWDLIRARAHFSDAVDEAMRLRVNGYSADATLNALLAEALERLAGVLAESNQLADAVAHYDLCLEVLSEIRAPEGVRARVRDRRMRAARGRYFD
jgi:hypothetical protein